MYSTSANPEEKLSTAPFDYKLVTLATISEQLLSFDLTSFDFLPTYNSSVHPKISFLTFPNPPITMTTQYR